MAAGGGTRNAGQLGAVAGLRSMGIGPWRICELETPRPLTVSIAEPEADNGPATVIRGPLTIEIPNMEVAPAAVTNLFHDSDHPDMRPWPTGMVIRPLPSGDHNVLGVVADLGMWDRLMSALMAPFRSASA